GEQDRVLRAYARGQPGQPDRPAGPRKRVREGWPRRGRGGGPETLPRFARGRGQRLPQARRGAGAPGSRGRGAGRVPGGRRQGREVRSLGDGGGPPLGARQRRRL
ncbi:MAG: hypothetical protein AVDCRST_MAG25-3555, partial [uncultured Rubrobacteraceae bacterium]